MPWSETDVLEERLRFIAAWLLREETVMDLCRRFGVSRKTGHKWILRFKEAGEAGLCDRSRASAAHPNATPSEVVAHLLQVKGAYPTWGPRKVVAWLADHRPGIAIPSPSTAGEILKRHGMVRPRKMRRRTPPWTAPLAGCNAPNDTWSADFKGWFRTGDGRRCDPLTVTDAHSRYAIGCWALTSMRYEAVRPRFERMFREYGLPAAIRTDNGTPFASVAVAGLSRLAVWWIKLGIMPERIAPAHPEQNGRHERFHRTLKAETARPPRASQRAQQRTFDAFRKEYNQERPHEALRMEAPASWYRPSERAYPARTPEISYPDHMRVRRVRSDGGIKWKGDILYLSEALIGEPVGLERETERHWAVHFGPLKLCLLDEQGSSIIRITPQWEDEA